MRKSPNVASKIINNLRKIEYTFPSGWMLFANSGTLVLVDGEMKIIAGFLGIPCDGGDPGTERVGNDEYLKCDGKI